MQTIKISVTDKGEFHWERYLLQKQESRLEFLISQLEIDPWTRRKILHIYKRKVTKENIIPLSSHPIKVFLYGMLRGDLDALTHCSTTQTPKS